MKTLIIYTSKTGVVADIAQTIADISDAEVELKNIKTDTISWDDTEEIVIGAGIYATRIAGSMRRFVRQHAEVIAQKKLHLFLSGANQTADVAVIAERDYPLNVVHNAKSITHVGGEFRFDKMGFFFRCLIKLIASKKAKDGDTPSVAIDEEAVRKIAKKLGRA